MGKLSDSAASDLVGRLAGKDMRAVRRGVFAIGCVIHLQLRVLLHSKAVSK